MTASNKPVKPPAESTAPDSTATPEKPTDKPTEPATSTPDTAAAKPDAPAPADAKPAQKVPPAPEKADPTATTPSNEKPKGISLKAGQVPVDPQVKVLQGWKKISTRPEEVAKKAEARMSSLQNTAGEIVAFVEVPSGKGDVTAFLQIDNPKKMRGVYYNFARGSVGMETVIVNQKQSAFLPFANKARWQVSATLANRAFVTPSNGILKAWKDNFQHLIFGAVVGMKPFSALIAAAKNPGSGYSVATYERIAVAQNRRYRSVQLRFTSPAKKGIPSSEMSMIFDGYLYLPTTVMINVTEGKNVYKTTWNCRWEHKKEAFDQNLFKLPQQGQLAGS